MKIKGVRFKVSAKGGDIEVRLQSYKGLHIQGEMQTLSRRIVEPIQSHDPTTISWVLPPENMNYLVWGMITPLARLFLAPSYERRVLQNGKSLPSRANPLKMKTKKISAGEWMGPPEVISIKVK